MELTEQPDLAKLERLIESDCISSSDRRRLTEYYQRAKANGGKVVVNYQQKTIDGLPFGRYYVFDKMLTSQYMDSDIRSELFGQTEFDVDIHNCYPTILNNIANKYGFKSIDLNQYCQDRNQYIDELGLTSDLVDRFNKIKGTDFDKYSLGKDIVRQVLCGKSNANLTNDWRTRDFPLNKKAKLMFRQIRKIVNQITSHNDFKRLCKNASHSGVAISNILSDIESNYITTVIEEAQTAGFRVTSYNFDGFQVQCSDRTELEEFLNNINNESNYRLLIKDWAIPFSENPKRKPVLEFETKVKQLQNSIEEKIYFDPVYFNSISIKSSEGVSTQAELDLKQQYFEKFHFISKSPMCIYSQVGDSYDFFTFKPRDFCLLNSNLLFKHRPMIDKSFVSDYWLKQPNRLTYDKMIWHPWTIKEPVLNQNCTIQVFNKFRGFNYIYEPDYVVNQSKVKPWLNHIYEVIASKDINVYNFIINWCAWIMQKPDRKTNVGMLLKSKQGTGKDAFLSFLKDILGNSSTKNHCYETSDVNTIFTNFNTYQEHNILTIGSELQSEGDIMRKSDRLKDLITRDCVSIEPKGFDRYTVPDYSNYVFTTNVENSIKIQADDRRIVCIEVSNTRIGDQKYFNDLFASRKNGALKDIFHYLCRVDISHIDNLQSHIPMTEFKRRLKEKAYNTDIKILIDLLKYIKVKGEIIFVDEVMSMYNLHCPKYKITNNKQFISKWLNLTDWVLPTRRKRIDERKNSWLVSRELLIDTIRKHLKDPEWEAPDWVQDEEGNLNQLVD